jgi:precorrin-3B C17-methyltransferase
MGKYSEVEVEVIPGVSAVNYSAALLGAPLHDFAVISLSDILTPLVEIKRKIRAASEADFIIAFYNPRSKQRTKPFKEALKILRDVRSHETLVGIVKTRETVSSVRIITLDQLKEEDVDMNTTLIVGNTFTYIDDGKMITPRGYQHTHWPAIFTKNILLVNVLKVPIHPVSSIPVTVTLKTVLTVIVLSILAAIPPQAGVG